MAISLADGEVNYLLDEIAPKQLVTAKLGCSNEIRDRGVLRP